MVRYCPVCYTKIRQDLIRKAIAERRTIPKHCSAACREKALGIKKREEGQYHSINNASIKNPESNIELQEFYKAIEEGKKTLDSEVEIKIKHLKPRDDSPLAEIELRQKIDAALRAENPLLEDILNSCYDEDAA